MIPELGHFALLLALLTSVAQSLLPLMGAARNDAGLMEAGCRAALLNLLLVLLAFFALMYAHVTDDFSVLNVALNSHTQKPLLYKITGSWASHEGSMLLWVLILTLFGAALARFDRAMPLPLRARAVAMQGMTGFGFLAFILFTSNPFARLWPAPENGHDLNPLLQDPGLAFHPPFLYLGYVGFSSCFALAAALLLGDSAARQFRFMRPYALVAWSGLTFGIAMGSWWSYYELGWGGYWFWDPVENAALIPWLAGTALVHSLVTSVKRQALQRWTVLLAILTFAFSLLGTFLVRSGLLTSVHAFASDPTRGIFMLGLIAIAVGGALMLYACRAPALAESPLFTPLSREAFMLANNLFLCTACATLLTGTLYPLLLTAVGGGSVSVGPPYFNATVLPLSMPVALLMAVAPVIGWRQGRVAMLRRLRLAAIIALAGVGLGLYLQGWKSVLGLIALGLGLWVCMASLRDVKALRLYHPQLPRLLAHFGFGVTLLGLAGSSFAEKYTFHMRPHDIVQAGAYRLELAEIINAPGPNYQAHCGIFHLTDASSGLTMTPEQRYYPVQNMAVTDVAIRTNLLRDLYLTLAEEPLENGEPLTFTVRFHINPLVPFIWLGGAVMALGGLAGMARRGAKAGPAADRASSPAPPTNRDAPA